MKLELQIPKKKNKKEIEKTYTAEGYDLPFGVVNNVLETLDFEKINDLKDDDVKIALGFAILKNIKEVKPLILDIFEGLTEEELNRVGVSKLVPIFIKIFMETKAQLTAEIKNAMGEHN